MHHAELRRLLTVAAALVIAQAGRPATAEGPSPRLIMVDPPGGQVGSSVDVEVSGAGLDGLIALHCDEPRIKGSRCGGSRFTIAIPADVPPGLYDLRALGANGLSSPRTFFVSPRPIVREAGTTGAAQAVERDVSLCGRIDPPGDVDAYRFRATSGQRIVIECWAERLDSTLRAVLALEDGRGRRLASSRDYRGLDPLIDFRAPADGEYVVRLHDLTYTGGPQHAYRLDIDAGPRAEFARPNVVERGKTTRVTLFGLNLNRGGDGETQPHRFDQIELDVTPPTSGASPLRRTFARPSQFGIDEFPVDVPGAPAPVLLGMTDVPVLLDGEGNQRPETARELPWPCEVSGRLEAGDEKDWYRLHARRGEVIWLELFGERIGAPVDLDLSVLDPGGSRELLHLADHLDDADGGAISTGHSDPSGRWVAPSTGDYRIVVRNVIGGTHRDPRRLYRLSVRREESDFQLLAIPGGGREPGGWNVPRGGRAWIELVALRSRGLSRPIRVTASGLPDGFECPDVWLGPGVDRAPLIVSSTRDASRDPAVLTLTGHADLGGVEIVHEARGAVVLSTDPPTPSARMTGRIMAAAGPEAPAVVTATPSQTTVSQSGVIDLLVHLEAAPGWRAGSVELTGIGIPAAGGDRVSPDPGDPSRTWFSAQVPEGLAPGPYSFAIRVDAVLTAPAENPGAKPRTRAITAFSNPVTIDVGAGAIDLRLDPKAPRTIRRGEVVQLHYRALRRNGFIGKIHTELYAPEGVSGLRARGVTFVGQTDSGVLQIVASDDAPPGRQRTLRLDAVGTVEDEPIHHAGCFVDLEIAR